MRLGAVLEASDLMRGFTHIVRTLALGSPILHCPAAAFLLQQGGSNSGVSLEDSSLAAGGVQQRLAIFWNVWLQPGEMFFRLLQPILIANGSSRR